MNILNQQSGRKHNRELALVPVADGVGALELAPHTAIVDFGGLSFTDILNEIL